MTTHPKLYVAQPSLPPLEEFLPSLQQIWQSKVLTNGGPFHARLESALCEHLGVPHISLFNNGTVGLVTALQALGITGEVITTPYSFVATAHSLLWHRIEPVFVDVDPRTLNLDPAHIERAITPRTTAIMPVHCYGNPCDVDAIDRIAARHGLRVIYDAAHAFGVRFNGTSVLNFGDLSVLSFHATKVFNTFEGGAIVCRDAAMKQRIDQLKNFGFVDEVTVVEAGINGKMNEFSAALGLLQLTKLDEAVRMRQAVDARYRAGLAATRGIECLDPVSGSTPNHSYFPIRVKRSYPLSRDALYDRLKEHGIFARRYFYPLISDFPMYRHLPSAAPEHLPVAARAAAEVICLPMYQALEPQNQDRVIAAIAQV
jgi:dTDP-4-amino-4,6-dideoxygalactose transaminase